MIYALKTSFSLYNLKILRPKVTKNLTKLLKKFCEFRPRFLRRFCYSLAHSFFRTRSSLKLPLQPQFQPCQSRQLRQHQLRWQNLECFNRIKPRWCFFDKAEKRLSLAGLRSLGEYFYYTDWMLSFAWSWPVSEKC